MAKKQTIASEIGSALGAAAARAEQLISSKPATTTSKPMAKRTTSAKHSVSAAKKTVKAEAPVQVEEAVAVAKMPEAAPETFEIDREEIAKQAYLYWEARGYQGGSPDEDWARAEEELKQRASNHSLSAAV